MDAYKQCCNQSAYIHGVLIFYALILRYLYI